MRTARVVFVVVVLLVGLGGGCLCDTESERNPKAVNVARFARWLVGEASWGVLTTLNKAAPFGNVASYTDAGTGSPYFYLSRKLDPTGKFALNDPRASFTVSQVELKDCQGKDPQSPLCAKITLSGNLLPLDGRENSKERAFAEAALFRTHPQFTGFPLKNGTFAVFKLYIDKIFLVNTAAPAVDLSPTDYFSPPDN